MKKLIGIVWSIIVGQMIVSGALGQDIIRRTDHIALECKDEAEKILSEYSFKDLVKWKGVNLTDFDQDVLKKYTENIYSLTKKINQKMKQESAAVNKHFLSSNGNRKEYNDYVRLTLEGLYLDEEISKELEMPLCQDSKEVDVEMQSNREGSSCISISRFISDPTATTDRIFTRMNFKLSYEGTFLKKAIKKYEKKWRKEGLEKCRSVSTSQLYLRGCLERNPGYGKSSISNATYYFPQLEWSIINGKVSFDDTQIRVGNEKKKLDELQSEDFYLSMLQTIFSEKIASISKDETKNTLGYNINKEMMDALLKEDPEKFVLYALPESCFKESSKIDSSKRVGKEKNPETDRPSKKKRKDTKVK